MTLREAQDIKDKLLFKRMKRKAYFNAFVRPVLYYLPILLLAITTQFRNPIIVFIFGVSTLSFAILYPIILSQSNSYNFMSDATDALIAKHKEKEEAKKLKQLERVADTVIFQHESKAKIEVLKKEIERLKTIGGADV